MQGITDPDEVESATIESIWRDACSANGDCAALTPDMLAQVSSSFINIIIIISNACPACCASWPEQNPLCVLTLVECHNALHIICHAASLSTATGTLTSMVACLHYHTI